MYEINLNDLPDSFDDSYLVIVSQKDVDLSNLDKILNNNGIITGLVNEFTYINKSSEMTSLLLKIDNDSEIHKDKLNSTIDDIYVCDISGYHSIMKSYKSSKSVNLDITEKTYGYNDIKALFKIKDNYIRVILLMPFSGNINVVDIAYNSLSSMFKIAHGIDIEREAIDNEYNLIALRFRIPLESFNSHVMKNLDIFMNQTLSILNIDKYTVLESMSISQEVISLLNE